jgi:nicotinate phosphoribosyltransferase
MVDPHNPQQPLPVPPGDVQDLLVPVFRRGNLVYEPPPAGVARQQTLRELERLPAGVKQLANAERYPVYLDQRLYELRERLRRMHQAEGSA